MMTRNPVKVEGIDHIVLKVTDVERSLRFYTEVLGLRLERIIEDIGVYQLRCGKNIIDLIKLPAGGTLAEKPHRELDHLALTVSGDIDEIIEFLKSKDIELGSPVRELYGATGFGTAVYVFDPDRHMIELKTNYCQYPVKTTARDALNTMTRP